MRAISLVVCLLLSGCAHALPASQPPPAAVARVRPSFELRHDSASERATAAQLDRLFNAYDLTPWHQGDVDAAVVELRAIAPGLPVGFPDGAQSETSSYEHLIVIALEERGLRRLVGELAAHEAMEFWATDHYRALYRVVLERRAEVWRVMRAHGLASPGD